MEIQEVKLFGASVISVNSVCGWNGQASTLEVSLVESLKDGDSFEPPIIGSPVYFEYGQLKFGGILQSTNKSGNSGGSPLYSVICVDPSVLLNGVRVILEGYNGTVNGIPNLVNIYGYYEGQSFGMSGSNGSGMSWSLIRNGIDAIVSQAIAGPYGGPIQFMGYNFTLDLSNIPDLPSYYRISGNMSLMDIIQQVCDAAGCTFFFKLIGTTITIFTLSRINVPNLGVIESFITQTDGAISKQIGYDMANETTGKVILGGKIRTMHFAYYDNGEDGNENTGLDNGIWYFWGFDKNGNPVLGDGISNYNADSHTFYLDSRDINIQGVGDVYPTSIGEMRAAIVNKEEWIDFLNLNNNLEYIFNINGSSQSSPVPLTAADAYSWSMVSSQYNYSHDGKENPHFRKSINLGLASNDNSNTLMTISGTQLENGQLNWNRLRQVYPGVVQDETEKLYNSIKQVAEENYGIRFMVRLQGVRAAYDVENNMPIFNMSPTDAGYLDENMLPTAIQNNMLPPDFYGITNEVNLIRPLARFDNIGELDFSNIPEDQMFYSADGNSIFVICNIDSDIFFLNTSNLSEPRVVVRLPGRVVYNKTSYVPMNATALFLQNAIANKNLSPQEQAEFELSLFSMYVKDNPAPFAAMPSMIAVPLESNTDKYGPWFAQGSIGAIDFEENDSLTPWNYGTHSNMHLAAQALVSQNISNIQIMESGSVEFPGMPTQDLGSQLLQTGPYISQIQISASSDGVKTLYRMEMWKPRFGTLNRTQADNIAKLGKMYNSLRRNTLENIKINRNNY